MLCVGIYLVCDLNKKQNILHRMKYIATSIIYLEVTNSFLVEIGNLRKSTINFIMSVRLFFRPFVRNKQIGSHWNHFYEIW
jgi:surface polysaccharide O-acyltransferase-like enzyme